MATDLGKARLDLVALIEGAVPADVTVSMYPPEDIVRVPWVFVDTATIGRSAQIRGGTLVSFPVVIVAPRTGSANAGEILDELMGLLWDAFSAGRGAIYQTLTSRTQPFDTGDIQYPCVILDVTVELGFDC